MFVYGLWTPGFGGSWDIHNMEMAHLRRQPSLPRLAGGWKRGSFPGLCGSSHVFYTAISAHWRIFGDLGTDTICIYVLRGT